MVYLVAGDSFVILILAFACTLLWRRSQIQGDNIATALSRTTAQAGALVNLGRVLSAVQSGDPGDVKLTNAAPRLAGAPWRGELDALARTVTDNGQALVTLTGTVTRHGDEIARLSPIVARTVARLDVIAPSPPPRHGTMVPPPNDAPPSRSADSVAAMVSEVQGKTQGAPVETKGDRAGVNPGDAIPDTPRTAAPDSDARRLSSKPPPPVEVVSSPASLSVVPPSSLPKLPRPDDEEGDQTRVYDADDAAEALAAALATSDPERPVSSARRTAEEGGLVVHFERADGSPLSDRPAPRARALRIGRQRPGWDLACEERFEAKVQAAAKGGVDVGHCVKKGSECRGAIGPCGCNCVACTRIKGLEDDAFLEVKGMVAPIAPTAQTIRAVSTGSGAWDVWRVEALDGEHLFTVRLMIYASGNGVYLVLAPGDALLHEGSFRFDAWDEATARGLVTGILAEQRPGAAVTLDSGKRPPRP